MTDKTTEGITAEPTEVEALLHNLCGYHLSEPDPVLRYTALTREQVLYDALVSTIKRERGRALADLVGTGRTLTDVAEMTNLRTRQRVQRLIALARAAEAAAAEIQAASRELEDRAAASPGVPAPREPVDDDPLLEATRPLPALAASLTPTKEMPGAEETPWWRRSRAGDGGRIDDTGAA